MMKNRHKIFLYILFLLLALKTYSQDPNFHIYLCFGQSNMEGQGTVGMQDQTVYSRFKVLQSVNCSNIGRSQGVWYDAVPPLARCYNGIGPADYFGRTMVENLPDNVTIGVIVVAVGGCDIALFENDNYASYVNEVRGDPDRSYMVAGIDDYGGNPYGRLVELARAAQNDGVIKGILMHQGETNTGQSDWPVRVKGIYDNLISDLGLNAPEVPFLLGEVLQSAGNCCSSHNNIIAQVPNVLPNSYVISSAGLDGVDIAHFTADAYRTFGVRYAEQMLQLVDIDDGSPTVTITSPENNSINTEPATISIEANATDSDGNISHVDFFNGTTLLFSDNSAPYSYNWENVTAGNYTISVVATDNEGKVSSDEISVTVNVQQGAYAGNPWTIPGIIQFEDFDVGGNGSAYYDNSAGSETEVTLRDGEDVDIEECTDEGSGYNIGYAISGEWLEYTVNVLQTGTYSLTFRVACNNDGRTLLLSYEDGTIIENNIAIPNTGGWQEWADLTISDIELQAGTQVFRVTIGENDYVNLNYMLFESSVVLPEINLVSPLNNAIYNENESIEISANASSSGTDLIVEFYANDILLSSDNSAPYSFNWSDMVADEYQIYAKATDSGGSKNSEIIDITVENAPEIIQLRAGWNLVGYPTLGVAEIPLALESIWQYVELVKNMEGFFDVQQPSYLNSISEVKWGVGYFIKVSENCELEW